MTSGQADEALRATAEEAIDAFERIALAATQRLAERGQHMGAMAGINAATSATTAQAMRASNDERELTCMTLQREPAVARLVLIDDDDRQEVVYITSAGTVDPSPVPLCSYMSPKGRLAPLAVGDGREIVLPGGVRRAYDVLEKVTFKPIEGGRGWDAQPAVQFRKDLPPRTVLSLRALLLGDGFTTDQVDAFEEYLRGAREAATGNVVDGLQRETLTAMQLRAAAILDPFQDDIFRLPLNSQIAVLGPPGTGKTTTLIKRLRQKVDLAFLDPETERPMVAAPAAAGLRHADSWIMFSPTDLLRLHLREAFGRAGVPVHDERLRTWDDFVREVGRRSLRFLRDGTGGGMVLRPLDGSLLPATLLDQIGWFEAFDAWQRDTFLRQLTLEAERLAAAADPTAGALGRQVGDAIARSDGRVLLLLGELAAFRDRLRAAAAAGRDEIRTALRAPLRSYWQADNGILPALERFVEQLDGEEADDAEIEDEDGDSDDDAAEERLEVARTRNAMEELFVRAMRARAIAQASGRTPAARSRAGRLLSWLRDRGLALPDLRVTGRALLVARAAQRLARAPADYPGKVALRYRAFRRAEREEGRWYAPGRFAARDAHPAEADLIMLAILRAVGDMEGDRLLMRRLGERTIPTVQAVQQLRRNQVLVDEATDFTPIQLACMRALADPRTGSFFMAGDFNQRLTRWGSRSDDQLTWIDADLDIRRIDISYRQSRQLAQFATTLAQAHGYVVDQRPPEYFDHGGYPPVLQLSLADRADQAAWLAKRIGEINRLADGALPTIAILVCDVAAMDPLADALSVALADLNVRAVACPRGQVKGRDGDVRIFEVEHIKGLEFEAVFFLDVDALEQREPDLFDRYLYVGATRAATFLAVTCGGDAPPAALAPMRDAFAAHW